MKRKILGIGLFLDRNRTLVETLAREHDFALPADQVCALGLQGRVRAWSPTPADFDLPQRQEKMASLVGWMADWLSKAGIPMESHREQLEALDRDVEAAWSMVEGVRELARNGGLDLLIVNADYAPPRRAAALAAKECGIPVLSIEHGLFAMFPDPETYRPSRRPFVPKLPDLLVVDNPLEELWHQRLESISNEKGSAVRGLGMPSDHDPRPISREDARRALDLEANRPVVMVPMTWVLSFLPSSIYETAGEGLDFYTELFDAVVRVAPEATLLFKAHPALAEPEILEGIHALLQEMARERGLAAPRLQVGRGDECLAAADLLVCPNTTSMIMEAFERDRPSIVSFRPSTFRTTFRPEALPTANELARRGLAFHVRDGQELESALREALHPDFPRGWLERAQALRAEMGVDLRTTAEKCAAISRWVAEEAPAAEIVVPAHSRWCPDRAIPEPTPPDDRVDDSVRAELARLPQYYRHVRQEILDAVPRGTRRLLDVGCAAGMLGNAVRIREPGCHSSGIELFGEAAGVARRLLDRFWQSDIESFDPPFREGEFDCIVFADVLEHTRDPWAIVRTYRRFLRPGGTMVVSIPNIRYLAVGEEILGQGRWQYADEGILDRTHLRFFTLGEFKALLDGEGMETTSIRPLMGDPRILQSRGTDGVVRWGRIAISDVTDSELVELGAFQFLYTSTPRIPVAVPEADLLSKADALCAEGRYEEALALIADLPPKPESLKRTGSILFALGRYTEATAQFHLLASLSPDDMDVHGALAALSLRREDMDRAETHLSRILERDPMHAESLFGMMRVCATRGDRAEAARFGRRFLESAPEDSRCADVRSLVGSWTGAMTTDSVTRPGSLRRRAPLPSDPMVSIVVPVYDGVDLTRQCVESIERTGSRHRFEIVVVDDASRDGTLALLRGFRDQGRIVLVEHHENLGFARSCNDGAEASKGDVLVFLNNDTVPDPGWLDELVAVLAADATIGIAGSRLLYPDGTIQHAGMIWHMGRGFPHPDHVFRAAPGDAPEVMVPLDYPCVTGACLAVPKALFLELGLFATDLGMYCEDVDFCLRTWDSGLRVRYVPSSSLLHLESATPIDAKLRSARGDKAADLLRASWSGRWPALLDSLPEWMWPPAARNWNPPAPFAASTPARSPSRPLRIGFDARTLSIPGSVVRGIGHYALHHLEAIAKARRDRDLTVLVDDRTPVGQDVRDRLLATGAKIAAWSSRSASDFDLVHVADPMTVELGYASPFQRFGATRLSATFYDLIPLRFYYGRAGNWPGYLARLDELADSRAHLLCISEFTRQDLLATGSISPTRTSTVMAGFNASGSGKTWSTREGDLLLGRLGIAKPFFLHVGSVDPHKNFESVLAVAQALRRERAVQLVVAGKLAYSLAETRDQILRAGIQDVVFTDFLAREELELLYSRAVATLFLSRYEGFGFPALEAMANGCPVVCSNATSLPEVVGDAAMSHAPDDLEGVVRSMRKLLDSPELRQDLSRKGRARARAFSWADVARKTWEAWDGIMAASEPSPRPAPAPARVQWISPVWDPSGYGDESRAFVRHLASTDLGVGLLAWGRHSESFRQAAKPEDRKRIDGLMGSELEPDRPIVLDMPAHAMGRLSGTGHHVGRTFFETDGLPPDWVARCNAMDEIWASCTFNKATFARAGVTRPILVVPGGVDTDRFRPGLAPLEIPGPRRTTTFLAVFEWTHRKAPDLLLHAWATAFAPTDDVRLVLRTYPPNQIEGDPVAWVETKIDEELARIGKRRSDCAPVAVIAKQVPDADMPRLYAAADIYLAPSRGEGWGRPHMEAMSCGVPVIATRWSGNLDFQTDDNSWLIDIDGLEEIDAREEFPFYRGQKWAMPSLARFVELLRESRDDLPSRRRKAERARADMVENWDWSKIAPLAETRLREILAGIPADRSELAEPRSIRAVRTDPVTSCGPIRWAGPVFNYSGYARLARETLKGLMDAGTPVSCDPQLNDKEFFAALSGKDAEIARWKNLLGATPIKGPLVICDIPRDAKGADVLAALARENAACDKRICWTMFETDRLPQGWVEALNTMDEVWVPSQFNRNTFARAGVRESKLHVVPGCIDAKPYATAAPRHLPGTGYTFLSVFQWIERKGWDVLLDAWSRAFRSTYPVRLVLRCHPFGKAEPVARQLEQFLSKRGLRRQDLAPIQLVEEFLPDDALPGLFAASDCFVLPSRGEGWGLPYLEAMAAGKPVIGTRWSAQTDFLTTDNSWLLSPRDPVAVGDAACREVPFLDASHRWADPSADELAKILRHAFEHPEEGRAKGRQGRLDATTKWTPAHTARAIADRLSAPPTTDRQAPTARSAAPLDPVGQGRVSDALANVASGIKASRDKSAAPAPPVPPPEPARQFLSIRWEGSQFVHHSLAHVNRELCLRLARKGHDLSLLPFEPDQFGPGGDPDLALLAQLHDAPLEGPCQVHVRHQWPPNLAAPAQGKWVVIQPWEFGSPPKEWIPVFSRQIDELWAYTNHVRDMYLEAGIPADKVFVVPLGVDCDKFRPNLPPFALATRKTFKFLYVGGTIARKGFDVLLNAWKEAFGPHDDVCLVVKDMGGGSFYKGQTARAWVREMQDSRRCAEIEYLDGDLAPGQVPSIYAACDVLVHPYRGEGFGLPIAEAMACGLPCIVTRGGAADDFCGEAESWGVQAERVPVPGGKVGPFETVAAPWWLEPSVPHLVERLREAFADANARQAKGEAARSRIASHFTWEQAAAIAERRLLELVRREPESLRPAPGKLTISSLDKLAKSITMQQAKPKPSNAPASKPPGPEDDLEEMGRMLLLAEASAARGGLAEADRITEEVVGRFPRQNMAWLARAMVLRGLGKFKKAADAIAKALQVRETPEALLEAMQIHLLADEAGPARKAEKALKERHAAWFTATREEFRAVGKPWPPDFTKPTRKAKPGPSERPVKK